MGGAGGADLRRGEVARLPEVEDLFQAAEDARQDGDDQGVDGGGNPGTLLLCLRGAAQAGDLVAEGGCVCFHGSHTN